jgi:hypothetical protein
MMGTTARFGLVMFLLGCGQEVDLGKTRQEIAGEPKAPPHPTSSGEVPGCAIEDPALIQPPARCLPVENSAVREFCLVTNDGRVVPHQRALPACPVGLYFGLGDDLPDVQKIEQAVVYYKGDGNDKAAFASDTGTPLPRSIQILPDRGAFFVRLDPRPSQGQTVWVSVRCAELFAGRTPNPCGFSYAFGTNFVAGDKAVP